MKRSSNNSQRFSWTVHTLATGKDDQIGFFTGILDRPSGTKFTQTTTLGSGIVTSTKGFFKGNLCKRFWWLSSPCVADEFGCPAAGQSGLNPWKAQTSTTNFAETSDFYCSAFTDASGAEPTGCPQATKVNRLADLKLEEPCGSAEVCGSGKIVFDQVNADYGAPDETDLQFCGVTP